MIIPFDRLSPEALNNLIEEFVSREGTDTGYTKGSLVESVAQVTAQLTKKQAFIVYDEKTKTCNIVSADYLRNNH